MPDSKIQRGDSLRSLGETFGIRNFMAEDLLGVVMPVALVQPQTQVGRGAAGHGFVAATVANISGVQLFNPAASGVTVEVVSIQLSSIANIIVVFGGTNIVKGSPSIASEYIDPMGGEPPLSGGFQRPNAVVRSFTQAAAAGTRWGRYICGLNRIELIIPGQMRFGPGVGVDVMTLAQNQELTVSYTWRELPLGTTT